MLFGTSHSPPKRTLPAHETNVNNTLKRTLWEPMFLCFSTFMPLPSKSLLTLGREGRKMMMCHLQHQKNISVKFDDDQDSVLVQPWTTGEGHYFGNEPFLYVFGGLVLLWKCGLLFGSVVVVVMKALWITDKNSFFHYDLSWDQIFE